METLEQRIEKLENRMNQGNRSLEGAVPPTATAPPEGKLARVAGNFLKWMGAEAPKFLSAAVLLIMGFAIKDSVDLSIKQRQLDLSYAKEMQAMLQKMGEKDASVVQLESAAVVLASYGESALGPLLNEMRYTGIRANAAVTGISSLALTHEKSVCAELPRFLSGSRARQYDLQAQLNFVRLLGENDCKDAVKPLRTYREIVVQARDGKEEAFKNIVREPPAAPAEDYPRLLSVIDRSLGMIEH